MDKWIKDLGAWKDYGLILVAIAIFTGILSVMALVRKIGLLASEDVRQHTWHLIKTTQFLCTLGVTKVS